MVEWYWQQKTEILKEKPTSIPLSPPQIPYGLDMVMTKKFSAPAIVPKIQGNSWGGGVKPSLDPR
jgi:hypothetical protein